MTVVVALLLQVVTPAQGVWCTAGELASLESSVGRMARGDAPLDPTGVSTSEPCPLMRLATEALQGWDTARRAATQGGAVEALAPVRAALAALERLEVEQSHLALESEYAQAALHSASAAAQDEREALALWLTHARDLAERLAARGRRAVWPRSFNLLAGELWFEVDRFDEAQDAFERALLSEVTPAALVGLARTQARRGQLTFACATYRRVRDAAPDLRRLAAIDLARCR